LQGGYGGDPELDCWAPTCDGGKPCIDDADCDHGCVVDPLTAPQQAHLETCACVEATGRCTDWHEPGWCTSIVEGVHCPGVVDCWN